MNNGPLTLLLQKSTSQPNFESTHIQRREKNKTRWKKIITRPTCNLKSRNNTVKVLAQPKNDERRREWFRFGGGETQVNVQDNFLPTKGRDINQTYYIFVYTEKQLFAANVVYKQYCQTLQTQQNNISIWA